jgi:epoxyqueuosine reductase QueG
MFLKHNPADGKFENTRKIKKLIRIHQIDLAGISDMTALDNIRSGISMRTAELLQNYPFAIVLGAQYGKLGKNGTGEETSLFLEKIAHSITSYIISKEKYAALTVHTDDEFDPIRRIGLLSLKMLAKSAGLGWQGRSLLIVSPEYGPIHRLIAVLTNMPLIADTSLPNQCGDCSRCIDQCPQKSLSLVKFQDHPESREEVLNMDSCLGDYSCTVCIRVCPWLKYDA